MRTSCLSSLRLSERQLQLPGAIVGCSPGSCPLEYCVDPEQRRQANKLKPEDLTNEQFFKAFQAVLKKRHQESKLMRVLVATEPHRRYKPGANEQEVHKHMYIQMTGPFAHDRPKQDLALDHSVHAEFSFNRSGWNTYSFYLLKESANKPQHRLDTEPFMFPKQSMESALKALENVSPQEASRKKNEKSNMKSSQAAKPASKAESKKRSTLDFSEFTVAENKWVKEAVAPNMRPRSGTQE